MLSNRLSPVVALALACAWPADGAWAQHKPVIPGRGQTGWGSAAPATQGSTPSSQASRAAAFRSGVFGFPFDARGLTAPGLGWLPGDPGNWVPNDARGDARGNFGADRYAPAFAPGEPYFVHSDAAATEAQDVAPEMTVAQGRNNYALPAVVRFCPNRGYYPAISECPQGWLYYQPEPPR